MLWRGSGPAVLHARRAARRLTAADPSPSPACLSPGPQVPPEQWGGNTLTLAQVDEFTAYVKANGGAGMMIWALKGKQGPPSPGDVTARMCAGLGLADCAVPLP
jgi:hypothetical protein